MKKKFIAGLALSFMFATSLGGVALSCFNPAVQQNIMTAEAATTKAENRTIQTKLKRWGYYTGAIDGIYGPQTKKAVRYFQSKNGLTVDGIVGPKTWEELLK